MIDLKARKIEMDNEIRDSLSEIIGRFYKDTGLTPTAIHFDVVDVTTTASTDSEIMTSKVTTEVKL